MPKYTYNGVTVTATGRRTSTRDDKKYMRTVTVDGKDYLVHYGDPNMEMKRDDPERRKAFLERHSCSTKKDPLAPGYWACLDWDRTNEGTTVNEQQSLDLLATNATLFTVPDGSEYTGVMLALFPSPAVAAQVAALPGVDMPAEALHVTLAYLGKVDALSDAQIAGAIMAAQKVGRCSDPVVGSINGVGRFNASGSSDGKDVIFAVTDLPGLDEVRSELLDALGDCDCEASDDHGYTPHMSLAYVDPGSVSPIATIATMPIRFDSLSVTVGGKRVDFPLLGIDEDEETDGKPAMMAHNADCGCNSVQLATNATAGTVKEVTRKGKRYLVAPTVALRAGVLNGELVPADEVAKYAEAWNGRPVPLGHPKDAGTPISANSMDVWDETPAMFWGAHVDGDALKGEIWLDIDKATALGGVALQALQRLRNNESIDVSTGYYRDFLTQPGSHDGKAYTGIARNLRPDHIAILLNETGACSWADGCGVPRINEAKATESASQSFLSALVRNVINSLGGKKVDRNKVIEGLVANAQCKCTKPQLEAMELDTLVAFADSLRPIVNEDAPTVEPVQAPVEVIKEVVPAELAQLAKVVEQFGGIEKLTAALSGVVANADKERSDLVAALVGNERNTLDEADLQAMSTDALRKLASAFTPRVYVGGANVATNADASGKTYVLQMPDPFAKKEAK